MESKINPYGFTKNAKVLFYFAGNQSNKITSISKTMKETGLDIDQIKMAIVEIENRLGVLK